MNRVLSVEQMRFADKYTIENLNIPKEVLVERAGEALANVVIEKYKGGRVLVCVGGGNNGQDGIICANILMNTHGFSVTVLDAFSNDFSVLNNHFDIIIDCIFGTGLNKPISGKVASLIKYINDSKAKKISCDIPSGLDANNGLICGICVKADITVAIQELKYGHFLNDAPDYCGEIIQKDIGISVWDENVAKLIEPYGLKKLFPERKRNVNKGNFGKVCIVGGSKNFPGSVVISSMGLSALRCGIGYCNLAVPECIYKTIAGIVPECTMYSLSSNDNGIIFNEQDFERLLKYNAIVFGMGIGVSREIYNALSYLIKEYHGVLIIDADGLNCLSEFGVDVLNEKSCKIILTPHIVEFSRLLKIDKNELLSSSMELSEKFAKKYGVCVILKSATSIVTDGERTFINKNGSSCLAKGGSGDLLSGILGGLAGRCDNELLASCTASYMLGLAGELCEKKLNAYSAVASDVVNELPFVIDFIQNSPEPF